MLRQGSFLFRPQGSILFRPKGSVPRARRGQTHAPFPWGEENQHAQHTLVEIGEEGNVDRVNRILGVVHAAAVEMLYPYTKQEPIDDEVICDRMWTPEDYEIVMKVPATMSRTTLHLLNKLIHEFMVARVIYDWLSITHPEAARNWLEKALEAQEEVNSIKNSRTGVLRRPSHPF